MGRGRDTVMTTFSDRNVVKKYFDPVTLRGIFMVISDVKSAFVYVYI